MIYRLTMALTLALVGLMMTGLWQASHASAAQARADLSAEAAR